MIYVSNLELIKKILILQGKILFPFMNEYKKQQVNNQIAKELNDFGFHIQEPRAKKHAKQGDLISYEGEPCELLELIEFSQNRELWQCKFLADSEPSFILL